MEAAVEGLLCFSAANVLIIRLSNMQRGYTLWKSTILRVCVDFGSSTCEYWTNDSHT